MTKKYDNINDYRNFFLLQVSNSRTQKEFGKLMGAVMQELKGKADGNVIKEQVKAHLG